MEQQVERVCAYRHCDVSIEGRRADCKFCKPAHKAAEARLLREDRNLAAFERCLETGARPRRPETWSEEHRAWVRRKLREREGLELRACDRAQVTAQLEDLGAL